MVSHKLVPGVNDLATTNPELVDEWDFEKNGDLTPDTVSHGLQLTVFWKCKLGHSWNATIANRAYGKTGCPYCSGNKVLVGFNDFASLYPKEAAEWDYEKNDGLTPEMYTKKSGKTVYWKCKYGHEWPSKILHRANGSGCPICSQRIQTSFPENAVFYYIKQVFPDAVNRFKAKYLGKMELDIFIPSIKTAIEYDGVHWHNSQKMLAREQKKNSICSKNGIRLIRVKEYKKINPLAEMISHTTDGNIQDISAAMVQYYIVRHHSSYDSYDIKAEDSIELDNIIKKVIGSISDKHVDVNVERDKQKIRESYLTQREKSLLEKKPYVASKWDYDKNGKLTPDMFSEHSGKPVWWKCDKCGVSFEKKISDMFHNGREELFLCHKCISENAYKNVSRQLSKPVRAISIKTGEKFEFTSITEGLKWVKGDAFRKDCTSNISSCCKGKIPHIYGYKWEYI